MTSEPSQPEAPSATRAPTPQGQALPGELQAVATEIVRLLRQAGASDAATPEVALSLATALHMESFSGPFPPPAVLERYEALYPGATKQLFTMAEQQATHRQGLERIAIRGDARRANLGLACGFVVALAGLGVSGFLIYSGHEVGGTILGSIDFVGLVGVFVYGTESRRRERTAKAEIMANGYAHREGRAARLENRGDNPPR